MGSNMTNRTPAEVFPPGEFLSDELEARSWTQTEFAQIIGRPVRVVNEIIGGKRAVTPETAADLAAAFGTSAQYWMNLESAYQLSKVPPRDERIAREAKLRERFPVREMIKRGWIRESKEPSQIEKAVLEYFAIDTIHAPIEFRHAARRNYECENVSEAQYAWIFRVAQLAAALRTPRFSPDKLRAAVPEIERLMTEPEEIRHVPRILAECGVRLIIVEPFPGSKIQGVCFWMDDQSTPVIGLSLKGDAIDKFWFDLWHELEHVLHGHGKNGLIIDDFESDDSEDECERIVNEAAADRCVPAKQMRDFIARHNPMFSEKSMIGFSRLMKRHPGIVAGQIQKRTGRWDLFKKHQVRVRQIVIQTALTDGYGRSAPSDI